MVAALEMVEPMTIGRSHSVAKGTILGWFCAVRQAELSLHRGRNSWDELRQFYIGDRLHRLAATVRELEAFAVADGRRISRSDFADLSLMHLPMIAARYLTNRFRKTWTFSTQELTFFAQAAGSALEAVSQIACPPVEDAIENRMDLAAAEGLIEMRLVGLLELRRATRIEHFGQATHLATYSWSEILPAETRRLKTQDGLLQRR
jgi:hypothetical protein